MNKYKTKKISLPNHGRKHTSVPESAFRFFPLDAEQKENEISLLKASEYIPQYGTPYQLNYFGTFTKKYFPSEMLQF